MVEADQHVAAFGGAGAVAFLSGADAQALCRAQFGGGGEEPDQFLDAVGGLCRGGRGEAQRGQNSANRGGGKQAGHVDSSC